MFFSEKALKGLRFVITSTLLFFLATSITHASIIYTVDRKLDSGPRVQGSIETDGSIGTLTSSSILDWDLTIFRSVSLFDNINSSNSAISLSGTGLTATSASLFFDFESLIDTQLQFREAGGLYPTNQTYWRLTAGPGTPPDGTGRETIYLSGGIPSPSVYGVQEIAFVATPVMEPGTLTMFILGIFGLCIRNRKMIRVINSSLFATSRVTRIL